MVSPFGAAYLQEQAFSTGSLPAPSAPLPDAKTLPSAEGPLHQPTRSGGESPPPLAQLQPQPAQQQGGAAAGQQQQRRSPSPDQWAAQQAQLEQQEAQEQEQQLEQHRAQAHQAALLAQQQRQKQAVAMGRLIEQQQQQQQSALLEKQLAAQQAALEQQRSEQQQWCTAAMRLIEQQQGQQAQQGQQGQRAQQMDWAAQRTPPPACPGCRQPVLPAVACACDGPLSLRRVSLPAGLHRSVHCTGVIVATGIISLIAAAVLVPCAALPAGLGALCIMQDSLLPSRVTGPILTSCLPTIAHQLQAGTANRSVLMVEASSLSRAGSSPGPSRAPNHISQASIAGAKVEADEDQQVCVRKRAVLCAPTLSCNSGSLLQLLAACRLVVWCRRLLAMHCWRIESAAARCFARTASVGTTLQPPLLHSHCLCAALLRCPLTQSTFHSPVPQMQEVLSIARELGVFPTCPADLEAQPSWVPPSLGAPPPPPPLPRADQRRSEESAQSQLQLLQQQLLQPRSHAPGLTRGHSHPPPASTQQQQQQLLQPAPQLRREEWSAGGGAAPPALLAQPGMQQQPAGRQLSADQLFELAHLLQRAKAAGIQLPQLASWPTQAPGPQAQPPVQPQLPPQQLHAAAQQQQLHGLVHQQQQQLAQPQPQPRRAETATFEHRSAMLAGLRRQISADAIHAHHVQQAQHAHRIQQAPQVQQAQQAAMHRQQLMLLEAAQAEQRKQLVQAQHAELLQLEQARQARQAQQAQQAQHTWLAADARLAAPPAPISQHTLQFAGPQQQRSAYAAPPAPLQRLPTAQQQLQPPPLQQGAASLYAQQQALLAQQRAEQQRWADAALSLLSQATR